MTLPFTWTLTGQYRVSDWPNYNIDMSQKIVRPRRGKEKRKKLACGTFRTHITFISEVHCLIWVHRRFVAYQNNYNNTIKEYWSQITIKILLIIKIVLITKKFAMLWAWIKCAVDTQSEQMLLENSTDRLALSRVTTDFQLVKNTVPANIVYCIKQNTIK